MASSGLSGLVGFARETTYGTYVAPTIFYPWRSFTPTLNRSILRHGTVDAGEVELDVDQISSGGVNVSASLSLPLYVTASTSLWEAMLGGTATGAGTSQSPNVIDPGTLGESLSIGVRLPQTDGTVRTYTLTGAKVTSWSITATPDEICMLDLDFVAQDISDTRTLSSPSVSTPAAYTFVNASVSVAGQPRNVRSVSLSGTNGISADRRVLGQATILEPLDVSQREYMFDVRSEHTTNTDYTVTRSSAVTSSAITLTFAAASNQLSVSAARCVQEGNPLPALSGTGILETSTRYMAYRDGTTPGIRVTRY